MNDINPLFYCFPKKITKPKIDDYIKAYDLKNVEVDNLLVSLYKRGYILPQPYMSKALSMCCFGRGSI